MNQTLRVIMEQHTERLLRVAYYYTKNIQTAEDIVQDVFIKFHEKYAAYEERGELGAYLTKMTVNQSKDYLKSWSYRKIQFHEKWSSLSSKSDVDSLLLKDEEILISEAIMNLPIKQREVIVMYYFEEMTIAQMADVLHIPVNTVKTRLRRGKELLKPALAGVEWEVLLNE